MVVPSTPITIGTVAAVGESYLYELVPLFTLPEVDLSVSVKSHFIQSRRIQRLIRAVASSPLTFVGYIVYLGIGVAIFFVSARNGRSLSVVGVLIGLPGTVVPLGNLRFDMVRLLLTTYDTWFFGGVSTGVSVLIGLLLDDARAPIMLLTWLSLMINICVDASILGLGKIWIANAFSVVCSVAIAAALSFEITDGLNAFQIIDVNGHALPAISVVRDCLTTMIIVVGRNIVRKYKHALNETKGATISTLSQCVSFRCRLQVHDVADLSRRPSAVSNVSQDATSSKSRLRYKSDVGCIDVRDTLVSMPRLWQARGTAVAGFRHPLPWIGVTGFIVTNIIYLADILCPHGYQAQVLLPIGVLAASASTIFIGATVAAMQRQLLRAVATSFDFLFIAVEIAVVHVSLADILKWQSKTSIAIFSNLQWCVWILCWDAITPQVRNRLGLSRHLAAFIGLSVMVVSAFVAVIVLVFKPPDAIQDRVIYRAQVFLHTTEVRSLTWYFSCVVTTSLWALRLIWRLMGASKNELVVLDGTVVYEIRGHTRPNVNERDQRIAQAPQPHKSPMTALSVIPPEE